MPFLLLIVLMLACMPIHWPRPEWGMDHRQAALATLGYVLLFLLAMWVISRRAVLGLRRGTVSQEIVGQRYYRARSIMSILALVGYGATLLEFGWGWVVRDALSILQVDGKWIGFPSVTEFVFESITPPKPGEFWMLVPGAELVVLAPFLLVMCGSWLIHFDAERAFHRHGSWDAAGEPFWSRWGYFLFRFRQFLVLVFVPVFLLLAQQGFARAFPQLSDNVWVRVLSFSAVPFFLIFLPMALPILLGLQRMPAGHVRDRMVANARRLGFRYRQIYLWDTRSGIANAMVVGLIPRLRYVVFTDRLLRELSDDEVDGVLGHEVGHARHGHLIYYAAFLLLSVVFVGAFYEVLRKSNWLGGQELRNWILLAPVLFMGGYMFLVFGFLSRRCERQADLFGCRAGSCNNPNCEGHDAQTVLSPRGTGLCRTGIDSFARALRRVESLNGMSRAAQGSARRGFIRRATGWFGAVVVWFQTWQHSTIEKRIAFLRRVADDLSLERKFQRWIFLLRAFILMFLIGSILAMGLIWGFDLILGSV